MKKIGVFLGRFQPIHNAHLRTIRKMLKENEEAYIVIGSSEKARTKRNPFSSGERNSFIMSVLDAEPKLKQAMKDKKLKVVTLKDWTDEDDEDVKTWGLYLYFNLVNIIGTKEFNIYYGDDINIIKSWFNDEMIKDKVTIVDMDRTTNKNKISSTQIRQAIINESSENNKFLSRALPTVMLGFVNYMRKVLKYVND